MFKPVLLLLTWLLLIGARADDVAIPATFPLTRFPPTFEDNALAYGFALFSLTAISAISTAILIGYVFDKHIAREIEIKLDLVAAEQLLASSSFRMYRFQIGALLLAALLGTLPDVLVLLAWGEASDQTMWLLFQLDRIGDGFAGLPFIAFALSFAISRERISHRLVVNAARIPVPLDWKKIRDKVQIVGWALVIACGVTLYKAGWA